MNDFRALVGPEWTRKLPQDHVDEILATAAATLEAYLAGWDAAQSIPDTPEVLERRHFVAISALHGNRPHPPEKEVLHWMEPGKGIYLNSRYETWVPNELEHFHDQVCRVFLSREYGAFREQERLRRAVITLSSPLYWARAQKNGLTWFFESFSDGAIA